MRPENNTVERALAELASKSHGVVTRADLLTTGLTLAEFRTRVRDGSLIRVHRGVYRVGHQAPSLEARFMAAVKAAGTGALLCRRAAVHLFGILKGSTPQPEVLTTAQRRARGVAIMRCRAIDARDATRWRGFR